MVPAPTAIGVAALITIASQAPDFMDLYRTEAQIAALAGIIPQTACDQVSCQTTFTVDDGILTRFVSRTKLFGGDVISMFGTDVLYKICESTDFARERRLCSASNGHRWLETYDGMEWRITKGLR